MEFDENIFLCSEFFPPVVGCRQKRLLSFLYVLVGVIDVVSCHVVDGDREKMCGVGRVYAASSSSPSSLPVNISMRAAVSILFLSSMIIWS